MSSSTDTPQGLADRYVAELMDGGHAVDPGQFTMDREAAREQLSEFGLPDPHYYVLLLMRTATLQGARRVEVRTDARGLALRFNGDALHREDLEALYDVAMGRGSDSRSRSLRALALGLRTASSLEDFVSLDVVSGDDLRSTRLRVERGRGEIIQDAPPGLRGTAIAIRFRGRRDHVAPEVGVIERRCGYADGEIYVNGQDVTQGLRLRMDEAVLTTTFDESGVRGAMGFVPEQEHAAELRLVHDGVLLTTHELDGADARFAAVVDTVGLALDLSQFDVIRDSQYDHLVRVVKQLYAASMDHKAAGSACKRLLKMQATSRLNRLEAHHGAKALRLFVASAAVSGLVLALPVLVLFVLGYEHARLWALVALGAFAAILATVWIVVTQSKRLERTTLALAVQSLPVGSKVRAMAVQMALRRGGVMARILK